VIEGTGVVQIFETVLRPVSSKNLLIYPEPAVLHTSCEVDPDGNRLETVLAGRVEQVELSQFMVNANLPNPASNPNAWNSNEYHDWGSDFIFYVNNTEHWISHPLSVPAGTDLELTLTFGWTYPYGSNAGMKLELLDASGMVVASDFAGFDYSYGYEVLELGLKANVDAETIRIRLGDQSGGSGHLTDLQLLKGISVGPRTKSIHPASTEDDLKEHLPKKLLL